MLHPSVKISSFQKILRVGETEREILWSNLLIVKQCSFVIPKGRLLRDRLITCKITARSWFLVMYKQNSI